MTKAIEKQTALLADLKFAGCTDTEYGASWNDTKKTTCPVDIRDIQSSEMGFLWEHLRVCGVDPVDRDVLVKEGYFIEQSYLPNAMEFAKKSAELYMASDLYGVRMERQVQRGEKIRDKNTWEAALKTLGGEVKAVYAYIVHNGAILDVIEALIRKEAARLVNGYVRYMDDPGGDAIAGGIAKVYDVVMEAVRFRSPQKKERMWKILKEAVVGDGGADGGAELIDDTHVMFPLFSGPQGGMSTSAMAAYHARRRRKKAELSGIPHSYLLEEGRTKWLAGIFSGRHGYEEMGMKLARETRVDDMEAFRQGIPAYDGASGYGTDYVSGKFSVITDKPKNSVDVHLDDYPKAELLRAGVLEAYMLGDAGEAQYRLSGSVCRCQMRSEAAYKARKEALSRLPSVVAMEADLVGFRSIQEKYARGQGSIGQRVRAVFTKYKAACKHAIGYYEIGKEALRYA